MKILVVVNPRAGSGRAATVADALCQALGRRGFDFEKVETRERDDGITLARQASARDAQVVAAVGGDGTFNEVCQSLISHGGEPAGGPELCLVPAGTASDLQRTLNLETDVSSIVRRLEHAPRRIDLGVVDFAPRGAPNARAQRAFLNITSVGFSAVVAARTNRTPKWVGGRLTYLGASLVSAITYANESLTLHMDGMPLYEGPVMLAAFCNGRYFGGGMKIAPDADPSDEQLDAVVLGDLSKLQSYALTSHIYEGTHVSRHRVSVSRGREFEVASSRADRKVEIEVDGETPGTLPARVRLLPRAVRLRC
jgi:YegS/Rv2252/BmrU family lipid kinase